LRDYNEAVTGVPPYYYSQAELTAMLREVWAAHYSNLDRLERIHDNMMVNGRYLALPMQTITQLAGFGQSNDAWIEAATKLGEDTLCRLFDEARVDPRDVALLTFTTVTGIAAPSLDARLMNCIPFSPHLKRVPLFGLGCAGGAAGVARVADYLDGHPREAAILLSVELCSLTLQPDDVSVANIVCSGLFGDGAAAVLLVGDEHPMVRSGQARVIDKRACFFPNTEHVMGWDITDRGFKIILRADVPELARAYLPPFIQAFLADHQLSLDDITHWIVHPGGPKVIDAMQDGLGLRDDAVRLSRESLAQIGNVSSASVLFMLKDTLAQQQPAPGTYGLMLAMGPAFGAEAVLLRW
jgi:alkylresorcinol/alkylpyrone synthase